MESTEPPPHEEAILGAKQSENPKPKPKKRRSKAASGALQEVLDAHPAIITGDHLLSAAEADLPPPESGVEPSASFAQRARPTGPKERPPGEPRSVFTSVDGGFRLTQDSSERAFAFSDSNPPTSDEKEAMRRIGMGYRSAPRKQWAAPATPEVREASDELALRFSGKRERIEAERGR